MGFSEDFLWGAASAAYQVEGAYNEDGKGLGIWDVLSEGHVVHNENGHMACDHYHRYKEDVALMKEMGLKTYRFSISWPRVLPEGSGKVNEKGIQFYRNLVDELKNAGIEPMITLFHWNLPYELHKKGGWQNPEIVEWFAEYTKVVIEALSDKVRYWMTFNEPQCFIGISYKRGIHAPFIDEPKALAGCTRNVLMAHGRAVQMIRKYAVLKPMIGMAPCGGISVPESNSTDDIETARKQSFTAKDVFSIAWWCDAPILGTFPQEACDELGVDSLFDEEEMKLVCQPLDFFGFNVYQSMGWPLLKDGYSVNSYQGCPRTTMEWPVTPEVMYWLARFLTDRYKLPVLITENGMSNIDFVMLDGKVHDPQRIDFVHRYLLSLKKAVEEGYPVMGYTYWSIMDNFEWADGYDKRFGLIHVNYQTFERTLKDSAYWYAEVIRCNGENL